jgi:predicted acyltransferase
MQGIKKTSRFLSLDVFRGLTVALMILVNSPGNQTAYPWLEHSSWNGCTLADLVFPFFIFILGVSIALTFNKAKENALPFPPLLKSILKRTIILFLLGLLLNVLPNHFDVSNLRIMGVLQRIAICYFIASVLFLTTHYLTQAIIMIGLMLAYWCLLLLPSYDLTFLGNFAAYIDRIILSPSHLYTKTFDPEGLLSTLPALSTALLGNLTGLWLIKTTKHQQRMLGMISMGILALVLGWVWGWWFPINKSLWTSSYVLWTGGIALITLTGCYWLIEVKHYKAWAKPFEIFGLNAILAYVLHVVFLKLQAMIVLPNSGDNLRLTITHYFFNWTSLPNASLFYAISYTLLWLMIIYLFFYKKKEAV